MHSPSISCLDAGYRQSTSTPFARVIPGRVLRSGLARGAANAATLAILNGFEPAEQAKPGYRIKVVISG